MIPAEMEEQILRLHLVEKWSVGTIARHCHVHHTTVRRVLHQVGAQRVEPARPSRIDPFVDFIVETLKKHPTLTASRLHAMVVERGYLGGPDHFRRVVSQYRPRKPAEAYQRLRTLVGEEAQVDWGHFGEHNVDGALRPLSAFVMVLSWSRMVFVQFSYDQRMGSFLDGHVEALAFFGGVPRRVLYDNLKSVVLERRADAIRFQPTALELASHYRFEPSPVAVRRGNEKGRVERTIRYLRTSFWPDRKWRDLDDLNEQALTWCREIAGARKWRGDESSTVNDAFQRERASLMALPDEAFPAEERTTVRVGKQPYARFDRNDYSVPHDRVRRQLTILASPKQVRIVDNDDVVAVHPRSYGRHRQIENEAHLKELTRLKAEARAARGIDRLHHVVPSSADLLKRTAERGHNLGSAVAALLRLLESWSGDAVEQAVKDALAAKTYHVAAVKQALDRRAQDLALPPPTSVTLPQDERVQNAWVKMHDLASYDLLDVEERSAGGSHE
jgi:transposase